MKKIKLNRFNIIIICVTFIVLLFFVSTFFHTYSEYATRDASKIEGDTVYVNDLANDYYYLLGQNYVGDIYSNNVNYTESDIKMVTVNYYGYPNGNNSLTGYVSLSEQQNKFVYYKYYPVVNNQISIELIDNPFTLRPEGKGFGGWTSPNGTVTKDSQTNVYTLTVSSSTTEVNVYANWQNAKVVFVKGENGDDNFDGSSDYLAVASWGRAFELLRTNNSNTADRELNIIVLTGPLDHSINYTRRVTHTWNYSYTYTDNTSFTNGEEYLIEYKNGNNRYALYDNYTNVGMETLTSTTKPTDRALWIITHDDNGYLIRNKDSGNYLSHEQYYNDQVAIYVRSNPVYWDYDTNLRTFFTTYNLSFTRYNFTVQNTISSNLYLIADRNTYTDNNGNQSMNIFNNSLTNTSIDSENYNETNLWRINQSGNGYTILNNSNNQYLNASSLDGTASLSQSNNSQIWNYDSANHTLSTDVTLYVTAHQFSTSNLAAGTTYIGYQNGNNYVLLNNNLAFTTFNGDNVPATSYQWTIEQSGNSYYFRNNNGQYIRCSNQGALSIVNSNRRTAFTISNNRVSYGTRYFYNNNGTLATVNNNQNGATLLYNVSVNDVQVANGQQLMYLRFNNNAWSISTTSSTVNIVSYQRVDTNVDRNFYLRYDTTNNNFTFDMSTTGTGLYFATYEENRTMAGTNRGNMANNDDYNNYSIGATITSVYGNTDYRSNATWTLTNTSYFRTLVHADLQLENLKISSTGYQSVSDANTSTDLRSTSSSLIGNAHNVRIGRGMTPDSWTNNSSVIFSFMQGAQNTISTGNNTANDSNHNFKFVVESGRYSGMMASHLRNNYNGTSNAYNHYGTIYTVIGNDYDRATNNNSLLDFYYRVGSKNYSGVNGKYNNPTGLAYLMTIKSGNIGANYFSTAVLVEDDPNDDDDAYAYSGVYVGGLTVSASNTNDDISSRVLIVEGGEIANIVGGLRLQQSTGNNGVATRIYIKNGTVANIVGGAGVSTTYGNRYISVTGGNVLYSVSGGSNGIAATNNDDQSGQLGGDTYVHVGGEAHIGTGTRTSVYDVQKGCVLGAGNGNDKPNIEASGQVKTSHVFISGDAIIEGNVFGGGNFGPVNVNSNVTIDGGTIKGNVYGGANKNGVGSVNITSSTVYNVNFTDDLSPTNGTTYVISKMNGNTRNMLSQSNATTISNIALGSTSQPETESRWQVNTSGNGYTIKNTRYNKYLAYTTTSSPSLTLADNTTNAIWNYDTTNKTFYRDIEYTVSATASFNYNFGTITSGKDYVITNTNTNSAYSLNSNLGRTTLSTNGEPETNAWTFTSDSGGYIIQNKQSHAYLTVSGGALATSPDTPCIWSWDSSNRRLTCNNYKLRYSTWSYFTVSTSNYSIYLGEITVNRTTNTARYYLVYNTSWRISTTASSIMLSTFTATSTSGYSVSGATNGNVNIRMNDGHVLGGIYGGACEEGNIAGTVTMDFYGGHIGYDSNDGSVFGGGYGQSTYVAGGVDLNIYDAKNLTIDGTVYGGSALGTIIGGIDVDAIDPAGNGSVDVKGDFYCGSMGDSSVSTTGNIQGNCSITLDGGKYEGSVFGGNNANGSPSGTVVVTTGGNNNTTINNVYAGGNQADSTATSATLNIETHSNITNAFGGGNQAAVANTHVNLHGGSVTNLYGGSNQSGNITTSTITVSGGSATNVYGGNNLGGTTSASDITITGGNISNLYGGGNEATTSTTAVHLNGGTVGNTYGGGNRAGVTTSTTVALAGSTCTNIFGGSNTSGNVPVSYITATSGSADNIYGGNNVGGVTTTSNVTISGASAGNVYGGGKEATTGTTNVTVNSGTITNVYGGGQSASVNTGTNVSVLGGTITNVFGGSNTSGTVPVSHVNITNGTIGTIYGGNNAGGTTTTTNVTVTTGTITNIYGGGNAANSTTTNVTLNNSVNQINYIFGGCKEANATTTNVTLNNGRASNVFGGSNTSGTITNSHVIVNDGTFGNVYGGNNDGGKTVTTDVQVLGGTVAIVFGGGNNAQTDYTNVIVDDATISNLLYGGGNNAAVNYNTNVILRNSAVVTNSAYAGGNNGQVLGNTSITANTRADIGQHLFGGGNNAEVSGNTSVILDNGVVRGNVFGGGNYGEVAGSTSVNIKNSVILGSAYAGGNGDTADVGQDTNITVQGTTTIAGHVFGGGNAADTGTSTNNNSHGTVNITGGIITGNVYGGANTAVLYGETVVNIGMDAVTTYMNNNNYTRGNIRIGGTVFGGGEANEQGSETYDFDFISVTRGIIINIDGNNHGSFDILGSIFGSGNASSTSGYSRIYINNYGSDSDIKNNVSLQRADLAVLNNSYMALSGATDRTNEYSQVEFSLSRITELDLKNSSRIYLERGANLLTHFKSLNADGTLAEVDINETTHAVDRKKGTNNAVYMLEDKVLNIALNQNVTAYGEVDGMTFFGMFKRDRDGNIITALYDTDYTTGSSASDSDLYYFSSGSYVLGLHETNHNIKVDGFYTNYADTSSGQGKILVDYITPTPENAEHYMWNIGLSVQSYDLEMFASKYSTLGTVEFPFINDSSGNTTFSVVGFHYDELDSNISIVNPDNVPRIAATGNAADNTIGLAIKPGIGWVSVGSTYFMTDSVKDYDGTITYKSENSNVTPSFVFYLYHSKNLQTEGPMGTVTITVKIQTPVDDLQFDVHLVNFNITMSRVIYDTNDYEGAMTPGRQYEMFTSSANDITSKSSLSAYYSLYMESNQTIYRSDYRRVLTSNVKLPVNTRITMIDFASSSMPEYYYYIVNQADNDALALANNFNVTHEIEYPLSNFIRMGSLDTTNKYDDSVANGIYYDSVNHRAIEEFIFILDFKNATINSSMNDCSLLIDMVDSSNNIVHSVLGIQRSNMVYSLHTGTQSAVSVTSSVSKPTLYAGDTEDLRVTITFNQNDVQSLNRIVDTTYYEQKLGLKISFFNESGNQVNGASLLGTSLTLDGETHYASSDGTFRFKVADKVANAYLPIRINTENSTLEAGLYTIRVEAFYSTDGIYFGKIPSDTSESTFRLMNKSYGLDVTIPDSELIIDHTTGLNDNKTRTLHATVTYSGSLVDPNIKAVLYRRSYATVNDLNYNLVNLTDYITNNVTEFGNNTKIYTIIDEQDETSSYTFNFDQNLTTGTYKLEFRLYDGTAYVGNIIKYVIIK